MRKVIISIISIFIFMPLAVQAQSERVRLSTAEDVAIAFYRTAGITPDFKKWIWHHEPYKATPAAKRRQIFDKEMNRLQAFYQGFNKRRDLLTVRVPVDIKPRQEEGAYYLGMTLKGLNQAHYLSYSYIKEKFAVFPYGMDVIMDSRIDEGLYNKLSDMNQSQAPAFVVAFMEVKEADAKRPYEIDGERQWLLKTKIQIMSLYMQDGGLLWEYTAPVDLAP